MNYIVVLMLYNVILMFNSLTFMLCIVVIVLHSVYFML